MPDIRIPAKFRTKMIALERQYLREIKTIHADGRREMLDVLSVNGVKISTIAQMRNVVYQIGTQSARIGAQMSELIDQVALWYLDQQRKLIIKVGEPEIPPTPQISILTADTRKSVYEQVLNKTPQWVDDMAQSVEINMTRLAVAEADLSTAVDRLLSVSVTDGRASVWRLAGANAQKSITTNTWITGMSAMSALYHMVQQTTKTVYMKQACAAIDERTTDCCLQVHGQIQPLDKPFILYGSPRFADKVDSPPFHWYCRSAETLYTEKFEEKGITTDEMKSAAQAEIDTREQTGGRAEIHPAHGTSRR